MERKDPPARCCKTQSARNRCSADPNVNGTQVCGGAHGRPGPCHVGPLQILLTSVSDACFNDSSPNHSSRLIYPSLRVNRLPSFRQHINTLPATNSRPLHGCIPVSGGPLLLFFYETLSLVRLIFVVSKKMPNNVVRSESWIVLICCS